jgi:hypothetical protein
MWFQIVNTLVGVWLMAAPSILGYADPARTNDRIVGPLVVSFAFVAIWEVTRGLRWVNLAFGVWLVVVPWLLGYDRVAAMNSVIGGVVVAFHATRGGAVSTRFGGGWSSLLSGRRPTGAA